MVHPLREGHEPWDCCEYLITQSLTISSLDCLRWKRGISATLVLPSQRRVRHVTMNTFCGLLPVSLFHTSTQLLCDATWAPLTRLGECYRQRFYVLLLPEHFVQRRYNRRQIPPRGRRIRSPSGVVQSWAPHLRGQRAYGFVRRRRKGPYEDDESRTKRGGRLLQ
ncbi:hypothetical protein BC628DRAFT_138218 [Trametes gibbosa]|nr:hypothetical protein BC628DRAFT_138218 [Trametes gibbosa]